MFFVARDARVDVPKFIEDRVQIVPRWWSASHLGLMVDRKMPGCRLYLRDAPLGE